MLRLVWIRLRCLYGHVLTQERTRRINISETDLNDSNSPGLETYVLQVVVNMVGKLYTRLVVQRYVDVAALLTQHFVADPASSHPYYGLCTRMGDTCEEEIKKLLLLVCQFDFDRCGCHYVVKCSAARAGLFPAVLAQCCLLSPVYPNQKMVQLEKKRTRMYIYYISVLRIHANFPCKRASSSQIAIARQYSFPASSRSPSPSAAAATLR